MFFRTGAGVEGFLELAQALSFQVFRFEKRLPLSCAPRKGQRSAGAFRSAKKHKFQRQQLANLCFSKRVTPMAPDPNGKQGGVFRARAKQQE